MSKKVMSLLVIALLTAGVACKSELDNQTAAQVEDPSELTEAEAAAGEPSDDEAAPELRVLAFDREASKIGWLGAKVTGDHDGGFNEWEGSAEVDADKQLHKVEFTVDTNSIWSDSERLTGHLKSDDFFAVEQFPESSFVSRSIEEGVADGAEGTHTVRGDMTIKDVTKTISFPVTIAVDDDTMKIASEFTLMRFDFNIEYRGQADDLIRDEVLMKLDFTLPLSAQALVADEAEETEAGEEG